MPVQTQQPFRTEVAKRAKRTAITTDRQALIDGLNHDLAGEYQAIVMYIHFSAMLTGPCRRELRAFFQAEIVDEQIHAQFLADKIAALGGEPATKPGPVPHAAQPPHRGSGIRKGHAPRHRTIAGLQCDERVTHADGIDGQRACATCPSGDE